VPHAAGSVARICQELIDRVVAAGLPKPSIYLVRGNRLRIQAAAGYHQIFDGMPFGAGVLGWTYTSGVTTVIDDVTAHEGYLSANPGVRAEVCVPVRAGGRVVGVLNVEAPEAFAPGVVERVEAEAAALGEAIERLGHDVGESPAQRLVRHAIRLGALTEPADVHAEAVAAARDIAGVDSAALLLRGEAGEVRTVAAEGPLADVVSHAAPADLGAIADLVQSGCSSYTVGGTVETAAEYATLRARGAEAVIAVPLPGAAGHRSVLLLADRRPLTPATDTVELLEALAAQVASCLRTAGALEELRRRAATDALTGLGHHATFHEALAGARDRREAVAVLLADVDGFKAINDSRGHQAGDRVLRETAAALSQALRRGDELFRIGGDEFAALLRVADEHEALEAGRRLREAVGRLGDVTVSVGVTFVRPGEPDAETLARADAALYEVKGAGRDGVALLS
jgi:diguanylate cyclase (GGDEF)-like protein